MLDVVRIPDLTFPQVELGRRETPWDLLPLLYRGGGAANAEPPPLPQFHITRRKVSVG